MLKGLTEAKNKVNKKRADMGLPPYTYRHKTIFVTCQCGHEKELPEEADLVFISCPMCRRIGKWEKTG